MGRHVEREILSALIDGELGADQRRLVHEHLKECAACRDALEEFSNIHGMVGGLPRLVAPESFISDVLQPPRRPVPRQVASAALSGRRRWIALGAMVTAIGITLAGLVTPQQGSVPPVGAFVQRHVSVHSGVEPGAQVLIAVNGR
jgi:anti-sigma factor RsiW